VRALFFSSCLLLLLFPVRLQAQENFPPQNAPAKKHWFIENNLCFGLAGGHRLFGDMFFVGRGRMFAGAKIVRGESLRDDAWFTESALLLGCRLARKSWFRMHFSAGPGRTDFWRMEEVLVSGIYAERKARGLRARGLSANLDLAVLGKKDFAGFGLTLFYNYNMHRSFAGITMNLKLGPML